ncbi:MAG: MBL fold metallo-hydrolase [SAR324 cluster bacterium]|nr:MBL fold metallo-hydrolase [SAR324 cluster bacterium]
MKFQRVQFLAQQTIRQGFKLIRKYHKQPVSSLVRPSVSAIIIAGDQLFMIRRQNYLRAFPGYHAFPGGVIDPEDSENAEIPDCPQNIPMDHFHALCRELKEELGFDLLNALQKGLIHEISPFGNALTPASNPVRYQTCFYKLVLSEKMRFLPDAGEIAWSGWATPRDFLKEYESGKILAVPPTLVAVERLAEDITVSGTGRLNPAVSPDEIFAIPFLSGIWQLMVASETLPPASTTNAFILGDSPGRRFLIDPSPNSELEYQRLCRSLAKHEIDGIFLTHHHPDHHQQSTRLARDLDKTMLLSHDTFQRIKEKWGRRYFRGVSVELVQEGCQLTWWKGQPVRVFEIPGHDEGQLGLAPDSMEWFLVGDLIQGLGTVVIASPEGNMKKYFESMERVISLNPAVIMPSHGIPSRGTTLLENTLKHRRMREKQILELLQSGKNRIQILKTLYQDIPRLLYPLAWKNINAHLDKLQEEQQL